MVASAGSEFEANLMFDVLHPNEFRIERLKPENVKVIISQQTLREIPHEKLAAQRRSNAIFAGGSGNYPTQIVGRMRS
jgi:hypothetical protein